MPRLESGASSAFAIASATGRGVCVPPGPSKWAEPSARWGKSARTAATSKEVMRRIYSTEGASAARHEGGDARRKCEREVAEPTHRSATPASGQSELDGVNAQRAECREPAAHAAEQHELQVGSHAGVLCERENG